MQEYLERFILKVPVLKSLYRKRTAKLKRHACLIACAFLRGSSAQPPG